MQQSLRQYRTWCAKYKRIQICKLAQQFLSVTQQSLPEYRTWRTKYKRIQIRKLHGRVSIDQAADPRVNEAGDESWLPSRWQLRAESRRACPIVASGVSFAVGLPLVGILRLEPLWSRGVWSGPIMLPGDSRCMAVWLPDLFAFGCLRVLARLLPPRWGTEDAEIKAPILFLPSSTLPSLFRIFFSLLR